MTSTPAAEFSHIVQASAVDSQSDGATFRREADDGERAALTKRFGLIDLPAFCFTASLKPAQIDRSFRLNGHISAAVVQSCVVTLDPVTSHIDQAFEILLIDEDGDRDGAVDLEEDHETFTGDSIDLGEIAAVELALSLDPYPRAPGVKDTTTGPGADPGESDNRDGAENDPDRPTYRPFAGLAALRRNR